VSEPTLVVAPAAWREACFSLPATRALAGICPVSVLCPPEQVPLWEAAGGLEVIPLDDSRSAVVRSLPKLDRALIWEPGPGSRACVKAQVLVRTGPPDKALRRDLTQPLELPTVSGPPRHRAQRYLDSVAVLGAQPMEPRWFEPLTQAGLQEGTLVAPDSPWGDHFGWSLDGWREVFAEIVPDPAKVKLAPGPRAAELAAELELEIVELDDPVRAGAFRWLIAADGPLPHVAGAFGTTCAVLFGPEDPAMVRPLGKRHTVIRHKVECSPCFAASCPLDLRCQHDLKPGEVIRQLRDFLGLG
jgi:hypothetical protein